MKAKLWIACLIFIAICAALIVKTYAVFETNADGDADLDMAAWTIKLNETTISDGVTHEFNVDDFIYSGSDSVEEGYIAPGMSGYFDVILDPAGTEVSIRYDITFIPPEAYADNITYSFSIDGDGDTSLVRTGEYTYSGVLDLESIEDEKQVTMRIELDWEDDEEYDEHDTLLGEVYNNKLSFPVSVSVIQYLGEPIVPYVEPIEEE